MALCRRKWEYTYTQTKKSRLELYFTSLVGCLLLNKARTTGSDLLEIRQRLITIE